MDTMSGQYQTSMVLTESQAATLKETVLDEGIRVWTNFDGQLHMGNGTDPGGVVVGAGGGTFEQPDSDVARPTEDKLRDLPAAPADYATLSDVFTNPNGVQFPAGVRTTDTALAPRAKTLLEASGRENTYVRTSGSGPVYDSTANFVTYKDQTIDRTAPGAGKGIYHRSANNANGPLEGFKALRVNVNGHQIGVDVGDIVIGSLEDSYIQDCVTGIRLRNTGVNASTMLRLQQLWLRNNSDYGADIEGAVCVTIDQVAFEKCKKGMRLAACAAVHLPNSYWERNAQPSEIIEVRSTHFNSGAVDGAAAPSELGGGTPAQLFYFVNSGTPGRHIFTGSWSVLNVTTAFGRADTGATIVVDTPDLGGVTWQAVNGGKVIFTYQMQGKAAFDPGDTAGGAQTTEFVDVSVPGVTEGDICSATFTNGGSDPTQFSFNANCIAPNLVRVFGRNNNTNPINLAAGTVYVTATKKPIIS